MTGPMEGIRVVEMGFWVAGPSAAAILGDWGADVVKIEPPTGDPFRGLMGGDMSPPFMLDNRGKRSIVLDLGTPTGLEVAHELIGAADVFVSNMRTEILSGWGLDYESLAARNPRLVYASITGYGLDGPDRDRASYDVGAYWARAGIAAALTPEGDTPPLQRGGMGDHSAGMAVAGGISAALFQRERTGNGQLVSTSLLRIGLYTLGWDGNSALRSDRATGRAMTRTTIPNPLINCYQDADGRWFWLLLLQGDRHWPDLVRAIERPDLLEDERFTTIVERWRNSEALVGILDEVFAKRPIAEWGPVLDENEVWWAPMQTVGEAVRDPQSEAAGGLVDVLEADGSTGKMIATPIDFSEPPGEVRGPVPELGQHTEEILLELGRDWDAIIELKDQGVIP